MKRRKLVIAMTALALVIGLAVFAATGGMLNVFNVQGTDIPDTDGH